LSVVSPAPDRKVRVERFVEVEDACSSLDRLVEQVAASGDVVTLTKQGKALAVLISRDEYLQMKLVASERKRTRAELAEILGSVRRQVREAGLDVEVVDEALETRKREPFDETAYLLKSPANAQRLSESLEQARDGQREEHPLSQ